MGCCPPARFELRDVSVEYNSTVALEHVDLKIEPGEAVVFVGPSGSGKTTLLRLLNGSLQPTRGTVVIADDVTNQMKDRELRKIRACIGAIHQDLDLVPNLRVLKNVLMGRLGRFSFARSLKEMLWPSRHHVVEIYKILDRVGISEKLYQRTDTLSGGQRQRVAVARALFQEPQALLADEPVSAVDPGRARDLVRLLRDISRERELTLVMSLHHLDLARKYFPRLVGLKKGRVVFDRAADNLGGEDFDHLYDLSRLASHEVQA